MWWKIVKRNKGFNKYWNSPHLEVYYYMIVVNLRTQDFTLTNCIGWNQRKRRSLSADRSPNTDHPNHLDFQIVSAAGGRHTDGQNSTAALCARTAVSGEIKSASWRTVNLLPCSVSDVARQKMPDLPTSAENYANKKFLTTRASLERGVEHFYGAGALKPSTCVILLC